MGGLLIVFSMIIPFLALSHYTEAGLTVFFVTLGCAAIGFARRLVQGQAPPLARARRPLEARSCWPGSPPGSAGRCTTSGLSTDVYAPVLDWRIGLSFGFFVLLFLIIAGAANGANLTDGIDGLAVGVGDDRADHVHGDERRHLDPLGDLDRARATPPRSTSRSSARLSPAARSASSGTTPSPPRCSWATPARWRSAARSAPSR